MLSFIHVYRKLGVEVEAAEVDKIMKQLPKELSGTNVHVEYCINVEYNKEIMQLGDLEKILWLVTETFEPEYISSSSPFLEVRNDPFEVIIEVGPRLAFSTAWSSNSISMLQACGVSCVTRMERSRRFKFTFPSSPNTPSHESFMSAIINALYDRMTECVYPEPLRTFSTDLTPEPVQVIPVLAEGRRALESINNARGLGFDDWDLDFYTAAFRDQLRRDPTDVELFDIGQSNSEHSRHWFFGGAIHLDGALQNHTLFNMVKSTLLPNSATSANSVIAFHDNSSAIYGCEVEVLVPEDPTTASAMQLQRKLLHPILTAETHNFPTGVAPFAGAETGTGGRLRDVQATGRGAHTLAGICGYCVGALDIPHHPLPWETTRAHANTDTATSNTEAFTSAKVESTDKSAPANAASWVYPTNLASPLNILIEASNGASDYGNKYGEPVVAGFTRSFGQMVPQLVPATGKVSGHGGSRTTANRVEWLKPVMFTAGVGLLDDAHSVKGAPEEGMLVCKVGGPAYRIGMGGGAASSRTVSTTNATTDQDNNKETELDLDFNAVQRGDAEMENRMNRVIRSCIELGSQNPIVSIHDQGAGGNGNVLKELVDPKGALIDLTAIPSGDLTLSVLEIWGAEYQENNAFLTHSRSSSDGPAGIDVIQRIAQRENCTVSVVGEVTGDGRIVVTAPTSIASADIPDAAPVVTPVDLPLSLVLGKMPQKHFHLTSPANVTVNNTQALCLPVGVTVMDALHRVLQLVDVGSKRFLTNKVDRSVTGLVAQQQCVGPLQTPLADVAVLAQAHFATTGIATAVGEQPLKGLVDSRIQARMTVCEALSNLVFAPIAGLESIKASCNWMWPAKLHEKVDGSTEAGADIQRAASVNMEGARMYSACTALRDCLLQLGVGIDGGKDSLTMAAQVGEETVKCPGQVVLTCYALCTDITNVLTPDFKHPDRGLILYVDLGEGYYRLGGTALSTVYNQAGRPFQPKQQQQQQEHRENADSNTVDSVGVPDLVSASHFLAAFQCIQHCLQHKYLQAGHDRSDGGLLVTLLEMAFAGNVGIDVTLQEAWNKKSVLDMDQDAALLPILFGEECGYVLEVLPEHLDIVVSVFREKGLSIECIGRVTSEKTIKVDYVCKKASGDKHRHSHSHSHSELSNNNDEASSHGASADNTNISVVDSNSSYISSSNNSNTNSNNNSNNNSSEDSSIVSYSTESSYLTQSTMHTSDISSLHSHTSTNSSASASSSSQPSQLAQPAQSILATSSATAVPTIEAATTANTNITTDPTLHTRTILHTSMTSLKDIWESTSFALELLQCQEDCVRQERDGLKHRTGPPHILTFTPISSVVVEEELQSGEKAERQSAPTSTTSSTAAYYTPYSSISRGPVEPHKHLVAILRQEGTNGDREMHAAFYTAGFTPYDVNMNDLLSGNTNNNTSLLDLSKFRGVVFCGGFSYADVHGSAKGWAGVIKFNPRLMSMFTAFKEREDTFSLGVCNGCQLMALLGWVGKPVESVESTSSAEPVPEELSAVERSVNASSRSVPASIEALQTRFIHNRSERFESRWSAVKILPSPAVLLQGMEGSTLGVWVAHGEGRVYYPQEATLQHILEHHLAPLRFVNDQNSVTEEYPFNPSGSAHGIAGLCSENGRHLALMPHPERSFLLWQIPYLPVEEKERLQAAPWLRLFQNAKAFCDNK